MPQIKNNRLVRKKDSQRRKQIEITLKAVSTNIDVQNGLNSKLAFREIAQNPYSHSYKVKITKEKNLLFKILPIHGPFRTTFTVNIVSTPLNKNKC